MKIYLHIGFPRSATTYMQKNYFFNNKEINFIARKLNYGTEDSNFFNLLKDWTIKDGSKLECSQTSQNCVSLVLNQDLASWTIFFLCLPHA